MTEQRKKLIERFQRWLDTNPRKQIIAAECANIAEQYHKQQLMLGDVVGRSEQLKCLMEDDKPNCNCELNHCLKKGWQHFNCLQRFADTRCQRGKVGGKQRVCAVMPPKGKFNF